ncbi:MAG: hypothetical protein KA275_01760 [Chitinophagaceae bacterium]|nr:hypothetical protein [Chitinophagaceae bacterium]
MKSILLFKLVLFTSLQLFSKPPRMAKYSVGNSGIQLYFPSKPDEAVVSYSEDSSKIFTISCLDTSQNAAYYFEAIVVTLNENINAQDHIDNLVIPYLDYLKKNFNISDAAGYGKGHTLENHQTAKGVIDYWVDNDGIKYNITAWGAEKYIVILIIKGADTYPIFNITEMYKKGVRFPGD